MSTAIIKQKKNNKNKRIIKNKKQNGMRKQMQNSEEVDEKSTQKVVSVKNKSVVFNTEAVLVNEPVQMTSCVTNHQLFNNVIDGSEKTPLKLKYIHDPTLDDDISSYRTIKPLLMPLKQVASLEPEHRQKLKQDHGHLAQYIFMTQRQKCKYFHEKNLKYNQKMQMPGSLPARKIQFKRNFQVKVFDKNMTPSQVKSKKSFKDKYNQKIHYS